MLVVLSATRMSVDLFVAVMKVTVSVAIMQLCNYAEKVGALVENIFVAPWLLFFEPFKMDVVEHCSSIIPK